MSDGVNRFLGDSPLRVVIKLVVISLIVGFLMKVFGWTPFGILHTIEDFLRDLWRQGFAALGSFGDYLLLGGAIVVPAFLIIRLLSIRR